jgi:hypothetical protein
MKQFIPKLIAYSDVIRPTVSGIILYSALTLIVLLTKQVTHYQQAINISANWHPGSELLLLLNDLLLRFFGANRIDTIVLSFFWMFVGLVVYLFLKAAISFFVEMAEDIAESAHFIHPRENTRVSETRELLTRGFFRVVVLIFTIIYAIWMIAFFSRESVSNVTAFGQRVGSEHILRVVLLFVLEVVLWYVLTILLRLIWMRKRLFG